MSEENTDTEAKDQESKQDDGLTPGAITRQGAPSIMDQVAAQEAAQKEGKAKKGDGADDSREEGSKQDDSGQTDGDEGTGTDSKEKDTEGTDKDDEGAQSQSVQRRLGEQRDKARKDGKNSDQRASYWEKRAKGEQFTPAESAAAGQAFETWPPLVEATQKAEGNAASKMDDSEEDPDPVPNQDDFKDHDAYIDQRSAWSARKEFQRLEKEQGEKAEKQKRDASNREAAVVWSDRLDAARGRHPDLDEVLLTADPGPMERSPVMMQVMAESEVGADLLYILANDADELRRIASLPVKDQVIEIASLEKKVLAEIKGGESKAKEGEKKPSRPVSSAPKIPPKIGSTSSAGGSTRMSDEEIRERLIGIDHPRTPRG